MLWPRLRNAPPPSPTLPQGEGRVRSLPLQPRPTPRLGEVSHPRACLPRSCLFSHHSRRESAAEAGPLEFLTLLAQAPRSVSPRATVCRLHSSAVYRHGFESARPLMLAMWRCRSRLKSPHLDPPYEEQGPAILNWDSNTVLVHAAILAGMTRVRLCEIGVPREVSSNRPRRPPAGHYRSMTETILVDTLHQCRGPKAPLLGGIRA